MGKKITQTPLQTTTRTLRRHQNCTHISNIFHHQLGQQTLRRLIPKHILRLIQTTLATSCSTIAALPELHMQATIEQEVQRCSDATTFQESWNAEIMESTNIQIQKYMKSQNKIAETTFESVDCSQKCSIDKYLSLEGNAQCELVVWNDERFIEQLNCFLEERPYQISLNLSIDQANGRL